MMRLTLTIVTAAILLLSAGPLRADNIQRSCEVRYSLSISDIREASTTLVLIDLGDFIPVPRAADGRDQLWKFSVRRGCGRAVPNRCRERASKAAWDCMLAHGKAPTRKPAICTGEGVRDYPFDNLERTIREQVCDWAVHNKRFHAGILPPAYDVNILLWANTSGDTGCGGPGKAIKNRVVYSAKLRCPIE